MLCVEDTWKQKSQDFIMHQGALLSSHQECEDQAERGEEDEEPGHGVEGLHQGVEGVSQKRLSDNESEGLLEHHGREVRGEVAPPAVDAGLGYRHVRGPVGCLRESLCSTMSSGQK